MKYLDKPNCFIPNSFFFRSAVNDITEGWFEWLSSGSEDPSEIWKNTLFEIAVKYWFKVEAQLKARKLDKEIERLFENDRIGIIDTDRLFDDE